MVWAIHLPERRLNPIYIWRAANVQALLRAKQVMQYVFSGYGGSNPNDWRDRGEWFYSIKCINPVNTSNQQPTLNSQPTIQPAVQPAVQPAIQPVPQMIPLAQQPVPFQPEKSNTGLIIGIIVGVLVLLALVIIIVVVVMKNRSVGKASSIAYDNIMYPNL